LFSQHIKKAELNITELLLHIMILAEKLLWKYTAFGMWCGSTLLSECGGTL